MKTLKAEEVNGKERNIRNWRGRQKEQTGSVHDFPTKA